MREGRGGGSSGGRGGELAGPQEFGDVLEGLGGGQADGVQAAEAQPVAGDLGDGRLDRDVGDAGRAAGAAAPGQPLDLLGVEQAAPAVRGTVPAQDAAADVGVQRRGLDAEPLGGLEGGQELGHAVTTGASRTKVGHGAVWR
jgi:hypothetical protein